MDYGTIAGFLGAMLLVVAALYFVIRLAVHDGIRDVIDESVEQQGGAGNETTDHYNP